MNIRAAQKVKYGQSTWVNNVPALLVFLFYSILFYFIHSVLRPDPTNWNETKSPSNSQLRVYSQYPKMNELLQMPQFENV
jgi:hypothetical protein